MNPLMIPQVRGSWHAECPTIFPLPSNWCEEHLALFPMPSNLDEILAHYWAPVSRKNLYLEFHSLARTWKQATSHSSSPAAIAMHPAYQRIIGMGPVAIPLILHELETEPHLWFWALKAITGEDPVQPGQRGKIREMAQAWLRWGNEHGFQW